MPNPENYPAIIQRVINVRKEQAQRDAEALEGERLTPEFFDNVTAFFKRHFPEPEREGVEIRLLGQVYNLDCITPIELGEIQVTIIASTYPFTPTNENYLIYPPRYSIDVKDLDAYLNLQSSKGELESRARARLGDLIIGGPPLPPKWVKPLTAKDINEYTDLLDSLEKLETKFSTRTLSNNSWGVPSFLS